MLNFAAADFVEIAKLMGEMIGIPPWQFAPTAKKIHPAIQKLMNHVHTLGLHVTFSELEKFTLAFNARQSINLAWYRQNVEHLYSVLHSELGARYFKYIPEGKVEYCLPAWLLFSPIHQVSDVYDEMQSAGRCFAYGENTASIFHLMRVADWGFRRVAKTLGISYDARNWNGLAQAMTKKMEQRYPDKAVDWRQREPFYAEILTDIQAIGRGHRNPALHELEKKYTEQEAFYMLTVMEAFVLRILKNP